MIKIEEILAEIVNTSLVAVIVFLTVTMIIR